MSVPPDVREVEANPTGWGFISIYAAAYAGTWLAVLTPIMVTLALRARQLEPTGSEYGLSLGAGRWRPVRAGEQPAGRLAQRSHDFRMGNEAAVADRWRGRRGGLALDRFDRPVYLPGCCVGWCLAQLAFNAVLAPFAALLPDHVPAERRGTVAGIISITTPLGTGRRHLSDEGPRRET